MFAHVIQNHEQLEYIPDTYVVNENNINIIFYIPNMNPDRDKEEHDYVDYEHQCAFFASLINNLKCDVEKCHKVNREARQANALLTKELDKYREKEKHFAKDKTIESEYCKKIKVLNDEIPNLKSYACEKDKAFAKENEKLRKVGHIDQTLRMLLLKEDNVNTGKQGLDFENQNNDVNPSLLNKSKELAPCLYNIDEMGKDLLSDHKIISEEELKCEAEKCLKVKQSKYPLSFEKETVSKLNPPQENVFTNSSIENNVKRIARNRLSEEFEPLVKDVNFQLNCFEKDKKFDKVFQKIESMKKKKFNSRISNDFLQKALYNSDSTNVKSESGEKKILFGNETSCFETKIKELEMILAQQTKDFEDAKVDFSKKTEKFETYFEKLEKTIVFLER
ncbi:hypothetical protein Tco_0923881 [Tanacetum coccineum]|uniref:Uncharacterized protein n=1 Tax=Tanacetum coccineum TaxID=301880 RepID=A0ABQ5D3C0_9ASTR